MKRSQAMERQPRHILKGYDLAGDTTRQANLDAACWGIRPTTVAQ